MRLTAQRRLLLFGFLGMLALALASCGTYPQNTLVPASDNNADIRRIYALVFWAGLGVFIVVEGLLVYAIFRYRRKKGRPEPKPVHGNMPLEIIWTLIPAAIILGIGIPTWNTIFRLSSPPAPDALKVKVIAHQWWWEFRYPEQKFTTANEFRIPVGRPVAFEIESGDVIHSFWIPRLAGKVDVFPGRVNTLTFIATRTGIFPAQCAEFCGVAHALMRFRAIVDTQEDFERWVKLQQSPPGEPTEALAKRGQQVFMSGACIACHTIQGTVAKGTIGPDLTHFGSRATLAAGTKPNTPENLAAWIADPQRIKPGAKMPSLGLPPQDIKALVAYLHSLQ